MRMHATGLRTQAYECARILVPRNPNLSFFASVSLFLSYLMPLFGPFVMFSKSLFLCLVVCLSLTC